MSRRGLTRWLLVVVSSAAALSPPPAGAVTRAEVLDRAKAYCFHPWPCSPENLTAECAPGVTSELTVGDHMGLPYKWGGFTSLHDFDLDIEAGHLAGSPPGTVFGCAAGLDCSGYVSACWKTPKKYGTATIHEVSHEISGDAMLPGDAWNIPSYHVILFGGLLADGTPLLYQATPPFVQIDAYGGWAEIDGYQPIRYDAIEDGGSDVGTLSNPIPIPSFPYSDQRDTTESTSDVFDACGAAAHLPETGPEFVYVFETTTPGTLLATVSDGAGVDIDLHLFRGPAERDCLARHDHTLEVQLDGCGEYYLVLDTWFHAPSGAELPGPYTLEVDFTPEPGECEAYGGYDGYQILGAIGEPCAWPDEPGLPLCNPNLGAAACLYASEDCTSGCSFCTFPCAADEDCQDEFFDGCCVPLPDDASYCVPEAVCPEPLPEPEAEPGAEIQPEAQPEAQPEPLPEPGPEPGPEPQLEPAVELATADPPPRDGGSGFEVPWWYGLETSDDEPAPRRDKSGCATAPPASWLWLIACLWALPARRPRRPVSSRGG